MSQEYGPEPDEIDHLFQDLTSGRLPPACPLTDAYHVLCDAKSVCGRRIGAEDSDSRGEIDQLARRFKRDVFRNAEEDRYTKPERVAARVLVLEGLVLSSGSLYAFYAEVTNAFGDWLVFTNSRCHRYSRGAAAMCVRSAWDPAAGYESDLLLSAAAFEEDLQRIGEQGLKLLYEDPGSLVLLQAHDTVEAALEKDGAPFARVIGLELRRKEGQAQLYFETEEGWYRVTAARHPTRATVSLLCAAAVPPEARPYNP